MVKKLGNKPSISIVIPSYNKVDFIEDTLKSILDQRYPNLEVIIQDGGSNDGSVGIIRKFASKWPNIRWISKKDKGQLDAINKGLKKAKGEILTYINADDVLKRGALNKIGSFFISNPDKHWVIGLGDIINSKGRKIADWVTSYKNFLVSVNNKNALIAVNYITQPSVFWRREVHKKIGYLSGTKNFVMEYEFWLKLMNLQKPGIIKDYISSFRMTTNNISSTQFNTLLSIDNKIAKKYTKNKFLILVHLLHNNARIVLINLFKNND